MDLETCVLCGQTDSTLPIVGIGRQNLRDDTGPMVAYPVCAACHVEPTHRLVPGVRLHFMPREMRDAAVLVSNKLRTLSEAGESLDLGR